MLKDKIAQQSCSSLPIEGEVEKADVVLQTRRQLGQAPRGAVHHAVSAAAGAHRGADGQHPASLQPTQQQEEQAEQRGRAGRHGQGPGGPESDKRLDIFSWFRGKENHGKSFHTLFCML